MNPSHHPTWKQRLARLALIIVCIAIGVGPMIQTGVVEAKSLDAEMTIIPGAGVPTMISGNLYEEASKKIDGFYKTMAIAGMTTFMNAFQSFTQRIAHDTAQAILTASNGQKPVFHEDGFAAYLEDVGRQVGDQVISDLNENFTEVYGVNLCEPFDPAKLTLGLGIGFAPPEQLQAKCTAKGVADAWEQTKASFSSVKDVNDVISAQFDPNASDLGVSLGVQQKFIDSKISATDAAKSDRLEGGGVKAVSDFITGKIKTPAEVVRAKMGQDDWLSPDNPGRDMLNNFFSTNAFEIGFSQIGLMTASTFINTLAQGWLKQLFDGLKPSNPADLVNVDLVNSQAAANRNVATARIVLSDLLTPNLISSDKQDFVIELSSCPTPRGIWNCAMDEAMATALRTQGEDGAFTVGQAAQMTTNGEPPSNPAFLHQEWELIPEWEVKDNTDPTCYQRAYCASNLSKLRFARIIPVGWEMAANSPYNQKRNGKYVTLGDVMRGFSSCNTAGEQDPAHPWCKMIDPNWVLTAPPFQCRVKGFGDTVFNGTALRVQECSDVASCLSRDDKGKCTGGYGYCLAEKPVWRFTADACLERFASCRTYTTKSGQAVSYLRNTIDYGSCSADNVGCLWYASMLTEKDISGRAWASSSKMYFDSTVKTCPSSAEGCTRLLRVEQNRSALNLVPNGSFEGGPTENDPNALSYWTIDPGSGEVTSEHADNGSRSMKLASNGQANVRSPSITLYPSRSYTLTVSVRSTDPAFQSGFAIFLDLYTKAGTPVSPANVYRSSGCDPLGASSVGFDQNVAAGDAKDWKTLTCTFTANADVSYGTFQLNGTNALADNIQLEEGERPTPFIDGESTSLASVHLKMPPDELACTGDEALDNPLCEKYARMCRQIDAGCQAYLDVNNPLAPKIPATLSALDYCPQSCIGYAEYLKQPSTFDLVHSEIAQLDDPEDQTSETFIPSTAAQCTIQDVGCEEFTNVEAAATGGESKVGYNYIQLCQKPGENSETYFTWEGSDTTGYQLRTWSLIHDATIVPNPPKVVYRVGPDRILKNPSSCNDVSWNAGTDPDCRQMYNANGDVFYVYMSQVVLSSPACKDYRLNATNVADCEKTGGSFTPTTGECVYQILPAGSSSCRADRVGCRAYLGATGRNTTLVFEESFNASDTAVFAFGPNTSGAKSNEAILVGDQSLKLTGTAPLGIEMKLKLSRNTLYRMSFWAKTTVPGQSASVVKLDAATIGNVTLTSDWQRFDVGPFSVTSADVTSTIAWLNLPNPTFIDQIRIERVADVTFVVRNSWKTPAQCDQTLEGVPLPQAMLGCRAYKDLDGTTYPIRQFAHLCRESAIGCTAFVDTRNTKTAYAETTLVSGTPVSNKVTDVAKAWDEKYIGDWTAAQPADRYVYAINESSKRCAEAEESCRAFGKPKLAQATLDVGSTQLTGDEAKALGGPNATSVTIGDYETVYFLDNTLQYVDGSGEPNMLCRKDELFCNEFKSGKTVAYFRDPMNHACEWRDKVQLKADPANGIPSNGAYTGWFRTGTEAPCYPELLSSGNTYLIQNAGDASYQGWVGKCPVEQSECTEFRDPNDHSDPLHPSGKPYFFIKNQRLDVSSCNGAVDLLKGCVLFRDMTDPRTQYATAASYGKYHEKGDTPQAPVDCVNDPENPQCISNKVCINTTLECDGQGCVEPKVAFPNCMYATCNTNDFACLQVQKFGGCTGVDTLKNVTGASCQNDADCVVEQTVNEDSYKVVGTCGVQNDANILMKVKLDRDCSEWLGCATAETVYDPAQQKYVDVCTELAMCDGTSGAGGGTFCSSYVNRDTEPVLKPGVFFDRTVYTKRTIGFGEQDYTGYAIPDQFQAADLENRLVGWELFDKESAIKNKFATDYRLVASVAEVTGLVEFPENENIPVNQTYPNLNICKHLQTGRTGYFKKGQPEGSRVCYFAISSLATRSASIAQLGASQTTDPRNIEPVSDVMRQSVDPLNDTMLQQAFPPAECKAYPESNSPFSNLYVKKWDETTQPFTPKEIVEGYKTVSLCEYGEACSCSYRRVKYGNGQKEKYYSPFGMAPVAGVCVGGKKDGQACIPGEQTSAETSGQTTQPTTEDVGCEGGGRCAAITDVVLVRGQSGQCLERDESRSVANDLGRHPCLVWNPNPILAGQQDIAHYNPTAGYMPPVNAGEYYCLSKADPPITSVWTAQSRTYWLDSRTRGSESSEPGDGANPFFSLPGSLSKFNYDMSYIGGECHNADECDKGSAVLEGKCNCHDGIADSSVAAEDRDWNEYENNNNFGGGAGQVMVDNCRLMFGLIEVAPANPRYCLELNRWQNLGQSIDGNKPRSGANQESPQAVRCTLAMSDEDPDAKSGIRPIENAPFMDYNRGRWIMTGRGLGRTYMEYFFPVKPSGVSNWLSPGSTQTAESMSAAMYESNFAQFQFFPVNDQYAAACSLPPEFVDGVSVADWSDVAQVGAASNQVFSAINKDFNGRLDRSKEDIIVSNTTGRPIKIGCSGLNDGQGAPAYGDQDGRCYMKYWEADYRMNGASKFVWLDEERETSFWDRHTRFYNRERTCSKSGFAIRAMFELADTSQNKLDEALVTKEQLNGPWKFIGFWVTACKAGDEWESSLYLSLRVTHADVCKDIAQVISPYSRENAAFADRVWAGGGFAVPQLGYIFGTQYAPFGSAMATGLPGREPLFQTSGPVENWSPLKPPTFIGSGASYVSNNDSPLFRWAHVSNIFARVYRVYSYNDSAVTKESSACIGGVNHGKRCPTQPNNDPNSVAFQDWLKTAEAICGTKGTCDDTKSSQAQKDSIHLCNGLSGVNAGLTCGSGVSLPSLDPICHNAPVRNVNGSLVPQYVACKPRAGWTQCADGQWRNPDDGVCYGTKSAHETYNAFGCDGTAVLPLAGCTKPEPASQDCPLRIDPGQIECISDDSGPNEGHCGTLEQGYSHARCTTNADCVFTVAQWWGAYDDGVPKGWRSSDPLPVNLTERFNAYDADDMGQWDGAPAIVARVYPTDRTKPAYNTFLPVSANPSLSQEPTNNDLYSLNSIPVTDGAASMSTLHRVKQDYDIGHNLNAKRFAGYSRHGARVKLNYDSALGRRYPSPSAVDSEYSQSANTLGIVQPGICEGAIGAAQDPGKTTDAQVVWVESTAPVFGGHKADRYALHVGECANGTLEGASCYSSTAGYAAAGQGGAWSNTPSCWDADATPGSCGKVVLQMNPDGSQVPAPGCLLPSGDPFTNNLDADNNSCTHNSGYSPINKVCSDQSSEKCLTGYALADVTKQDSLDYTTPQPTDVTSGFHKPSYLGLTPSDPAREAYIAFYAPRPPTVAAPDLAHACAAPGQCKIAEVGAFTLESQTSGAIYYSGGKGQISMKFYGWADHEQVPLKALFIDWGDGSRTTIDNARMKNKKPFCGGLSECELVPGLTCESDADCPAAGGKCAQRGTCTQNPSKSCFRNADCQVSGNAKDTCTPRPFFGNSEEACEANYFEFSHAYACNPKNMPSCKYPDGSEILRCSRNPDLVCTAANYTTVCGSGDTCVAGLAPSGVEGSIAGCYDPDKVACRYTPKLMLKDNWNWCTGECRKGDVVAGQPTDVTTGAPATQSSVRHVYGGCWDGTETKKNTKIGDSTQDEFIMTGPHNECRTESITSDYLEGISSPIEQKLIRSIRPWVVFQGSVQIGIFE